MTSQNSYNSSERLSIKTRMLLTALVLTGAINWGTTAYGYNLVEMISTFINNLFKSNIPINTIIYLAVAASAVILMMSRTTWLPFLGMTVVPSNLVPVKPLSESDRVIKVNVKPNTKVIYWASKSTDSNIDVMKAYGDYTNSGVVISNENGVAELPIKEGAGYVVPSGYRLSRHIHYRVFDSDAMLSRVYTTFY